MAISFSQLGKHGALCNSLFQIACVVSLAKRNNDSYIFPINWQYRNEFELPSNCFVSRIKPTSTYNEPHFHYAEIPYKPNMDILGYFQSYKYFEDMDADIRQLFTPKQMVSEQPGTTSIHVRRTDYLNHPNHHPVLGMDYYEKAMEMVGGSKFLVFSDDMAWCKEHFIGNQFEFCHNDNAVLDLSLQTKCDNNIIANSSFSWWGAWLNNKPNKKVIAPKRWFGPALSMHDTKDLLPTTWVVI